MTDICRGLAVFVSAFFPAVIHGQANFEVIEGFQVGSLNWSIAADSTGTATPNILSELKWTNLHIVQIGAAGDITAVNGWQVRGSLIYGTITDGDLQDSDYFGNNRTLEFSRSNNDSKGDDVWAASLAVGKRIDLPRQLIGADGDAFLTPLLGYSHHTQYLRITSGNQTIPPLGPFANLDSTYQTRWRGPWVGLELILAGSERVHSFLRIEHHWLDYYGEANWNLRSDFQHPVSFTHTADGTGSIIAIGLFNPPRKGKISLKASMEFQDWETDPGTHRAFLTTGSVSTTRLNEVRSVSRSISFALRYAL